MDEYISYERWSSPAQSRGWGRWIGFLAAVGVVLTGCRGRLSEQHGEVFQQAVQASERANPAFAANAAYRYIQGATVDDPRYDRALHLLARNVERLELSYAASLWYMDIARARRNVQQVDDAIASLKRVLERYPYDRETLVRGFLGKADVSNLSGELKGFVAYHQGLTSLRRGDTKWGLKSFDTIPEETPYRLRARYVLAVGKIARRQIDTGKKALTSLLEEDLPPDLELDVRRTLARTEFDRDNWEKALGHYRAIQDRAPDHPRLLLEMAWTHYYLGHYKRALGLLIALDAPAYRELIAPRRYLLEALALKNLCQFGPAQTAARRLQTRYDQALEDLHRGVPLEHSEPLREAVGLRAGGRQIVSFRQRVERERKRLKQLEGRLTEPLMTRLRAMYQQGVREARRRERQELNDELEALADELLSAEEGVQLVLHELGVSLLRGQRESTQTDRGRAFDDVIDQPVTYRFDGEFWTDELDDLIVQLEDRCIKEE